MTEPRKTVDYFLKYNDVAISVLDRTYFAPHDPLSQVERIKKAMQGYAAQQVTQERERIKNLLRNEYSEKLTYLKEINHYDEEMRESKNKYADAKIYEFGKLLELIDSL